MFLWIKALHIAAIVAWVSGLLMLALMMRVLATAPARGCVKTLLAI